VLRQVWVNLLSNAVKFSSRKEKPVIEVEGIMEGDTAVYRVRDNGAGFDMAYAGKLFGVFQRLHGMNEFEGTGVGLALVHRIVSRHGGRVWAEGAVGQGATFSFALPARIAAGADENGVQSHRKAGGT
jgi:light-regulated signal transduction histidine kinase (bacteriophytochrome)